MATRAQKKKRRETIAAFGSPIGETKEGAESPKTALFSPGAGPDELRDDAKLVAIAAQNRWATCPEKRAEIVRLLEEKLISEEIDDKTFALLIRPYVQVESQNQRDDLAHHQQQNPEVPLTPPVTVNQPQVVMICPSNGRGPTPDQVVDGKVVEGWSDD